MIGWAAFAGCTLIIASSLMVVTAVGRLVVFRKRVRLPRARVRKGVKA